MNTQRDKQESKTLLLETHTVIYVIVNAVDNKRQTCILRWTDKEINRTGRQFYIRSK
jgi:hypothetical protein